MLEVIGTGSSGNCYILTSKSGQQLLLDCGVRLSGIMKGLRYDIMKSQGCLVTHSHKDHVLSADKLELYGIDVWKPYEDIEKNNMTVREFGDFKAMCFEVQHDVPCVGYLIKYDGRKLLYITDAEYCKYTFKRQKVLGIIEASEPVGAPVEYLLIEVLILIHILRDILKGLHLYEQVEVLGQYKEDIRGLPLHYLLGQPLGVILL